MHTSHLYVFDPMVRFALISCPLTGSSSFNFFRLISSMIYGFLLSFSNPLLLRIVTSAAVSVTADISNLFTFIGTTSVSPTNSPCAWQITTSFSCLGGGICDDDDDGDVFCGNDGTDDNDDDDDDNNNECGGGWPV